MLIEVIAVGIVILVSPVQPKNAPSPIEVTELGMVVFLQPATRELVKVSIIALQPCLLSYTGFPSSTVIKIRLEQ